jgi:hypothetical protein
VTPLKGARVRAGIFFALWLLVLPPAFMIGFVAIGMLAPGGLGATVAGYLFDAAETVFQNDFIITATGIRAQWPTLVQAALWVLMGVGFACATGRLRGKYTFWLAPVAVVLGIVVVSFAMPILGFAPVGGNAP